METGDPTAARLFLVGLAIRCPFSQDQPEECPLAPIRRKPLEERLDWIDSLFDEEVESIVANHRLCLDRKVHRER